MIRAIAALLLLVAVVFLAFSVSEVFHATKRGRFIAAVGNAQHRKIDAEDLVAHWRAEWVEQAIVGGLIAAAGVVLWQQKPIGLLLFAMTAAGQLAVDVAKYVLGYSRYQFEIPEPIGVALYLLAIIAGTVGFVRLRTKGRLAGGPDDRSPLG